MSKIKELPLIIYQNTYFTESLYSIINEGDIDSQKTMAENGSSGKAEGGAGIGLSSIPMLNKIIDFQLKGQYEKTGILRIEEDKKITASYKFSKIKEYISKEKITCTEIDHKTDFSKLELGQFVEFTSNYKKNEIRELIDMLLNEDVLDLLLSLPQLNNNSMFFKESVEETEFSAKISEDPKTKELNKISDKRGTWKQVKSTPVKTELTKNIYKIIERLKKDFPEEAITLDFYGQIKDTDIRNFLICDTKFFVQEDKNRILDGKFRVFGKIIDIQDEIVVKSENSIEKAFSQLDRNQFFKRATKEAIEDLETLIKESIDKIKVENKNWFDSKINLITTGQAIKVLPIVIYT